MKRPVHSARRPSLPSQPTHTPAEIQEWIRTAGVAFARATESEARLRTENDKLRQLLNASEQLKLRSGTQKVWLLTDEEYQSLLKGKGQ